MRGQRDTNLSGQRERLGRARVIKELEALCIAGLLFLGVGKCHYMSA